MEKLGELEVQLALAKMETEDAYREQREGTERALASLESTIRKIEATEEDHGLVHYQNFVRRVRRLEDKLATMHVHFALEKNRTGDELREAKDELREKVRELGR